MSDVQNTKGPDRLWANPSDSDVGEGHCFVTFDFEVTEHKVEYIRADIANETLEALKDARYILYGGGPGNPKIDAAIAKAEGKDNG